MTALRVVLGVGIQESAAWLRRESYKVVGFFLFCNFLLLSFKYSFLCHSNNNNFCFLAFVLSKGGEKKFRVKFFGGVSNLVLWIFLFVLESNALLIIGSVSYCLTNYLIMCKSLVATFSGFRSQSRSYNSFSFELGLVLLVRFIDLIAAQWLSDLNLHHLYLWLCC